MDLPFPPSFVCLFFFSCDVSSDLFFGTCAIIVADHALGNSQLSFFAGHRGGRVLVV